MKQTYQFQIYSFLHCSLYFVYSILLLKRKIIFEIISQFKNSPTYWENQFMIQPTVSAYQDLLKQFYRKTIKTHPNRHDLIAKYIKKMVVIGQQKYLEVQSPTMNSPRSNRSNKSNANNLEIIDITKSKSGSSREIEPQSAKILKKYSDEKSSLSGDSDLSKQRRKNRDQEKYFNCEWIYKCTNLRKTLCFAIIYMYFQNNDGYNFTKLNESIELYLNENSGFQNLQIQNACTQWGKVQQTFNKKDKVRWTKILPQIFINIPVTFINLVFEFLTRTKTSVEDLKSLTKQMIELMHRYVKININYFQIFHQQIERSVQKMGSYKVQINLGYIKQDDTFVFSNRFPQKSQKQSKKEKAIKNISQSIANLLKQYDANTQKLMSLDILTQTTSKQANIKNYLSKKDVLK